jgi:hypothetical protein
METQRMGIREAPALQATAAMIADDAKRKRRSSTGWPLPIIKPPLQPRICLF